MLQPPKRESDVERYLVMRVKQLGGEIRKVAWVGKSGAPDRFVMRTGRRGVWVEVKAPGLAKSFPSNAHERAQKREHDRMRRCGQIVFVVDSYEGVEELLK